MSAEILNNFILDKKIKIEFSESLDGLKGFCMIRV